MVSLRFISVAVAVMGMPAVALAQSAGDETVVSASHGTTLPAADTTTATPVLAPVRPSATPEQTVAWLTAASKPVQGDTTAAAAPSDPAPLKGMDAWGRTIHGSAGVSIGTGGYRSGYVSSIIPIGENGTLGIAISQTDYGKNNIYSGRGYGWGRRGSSQSIALSLDLSKDAREGDCTSYGNDGDVVWSAHMHAHDASCAGDDRY